jgi:prefoldin subunit 5
MKMKKIFSFIMLTMLLGIFATTAYSQCPSDIKGNPSCPDHQLYEDQAVIRIQDFKTKIAGLEEQLQALKADMAGLEKKLETTKTSIKDCNDNLYGMLGATMADVNAFRQQLGVIEGKLREMQRLPDDVLADRQADVFALESELNELRKNKISMLAEFYPKIIKLAKEINPGLLREKKVKEYIVKSWFENRDCLWNIAGNVDIYGDPLQWPKVWQANTNIIRNPDLIHPGQVLSIPPAGPKSPEELKAERKYWREKREAQETQTQGTQGQ